MARYYFQVINDEPNDAVSVTFEADDIWRVLDRFKAFLAAGDFPCIDLVTAVSYDPEDEAKDIHYFSDGDVMLAKEIDNNNNPDNAPAKEAN
jgi:hypothetical protein